MWDKDYIYNLVNETVINVTKRVAGITLSPSPESAENFDADWSVIKISISGMENECSFYYRAQPHVYRAIAEFMKRRPLESDEDMEVYIKEYFNILCGRIVSRLNRETKSSMRFGLPIYSETGEAPWGDPMFRLCFECMGSDGIISITGVAKKVPLDTADTE